MWQHLKQPQIYTCTCNQSVKLSTSVLQLSLSIRVTLNWEEDWKGYTHPRRTTRLIQLGMSTPFILPYVLTICDLTICDVHHLHLTPFILLFGCALSMGLFIVCVFINVSLIFFLLIVVLISVFSLNYSSSIFVHVPIPDEGVPKIHTCRKFVSDFPFFL